MRSRELAAALVAVAAMIGVSAHAADNARTKKGKTAAAKKAPAKAEAIVVNVPPPSGTWEGKPPPAEGYVWSAGYYAWKDDRYVWTPGEWVLDRPGFDYRQHAWVQRADGKWTMTGGDWVPEKSGS